MPILPEELFLEAVDQLVSIDRDWIPDGDGSLYHPALHVRQRDLPRREAVVGLPVHRHRLVGRLVLQDRAPTRFRSGSRRNTRAPRRAAPAPPNAAATMPPACSPRPKRPGTAATRSCSSTPSSASWIEELGGMNIFFVFNDGSMVDAAARRHDPARRHALLAAHPGQGQGHRGARGPLFDRPMARRRRQRPPARGLRLRHRRRRDADRHGPQHRRASSRSATAARAPRTEELKAALVDIQRGRAADPHGWIHKVF